MKQILQRFSQGDKLSVSEAKTVLLQITSGSFSNEEVAAFLMALNMRSLVIDELVGFRAAMLEQALTVEFDFDTIDIVGSGGDGKNTFNISTCAAIVIAGAGYKVAKHGSYGVSSVSGSANVLQEVGVEFTNNFDSLKYLLEKTNFCFLHAPLFHPAMKHVVPIRKALKVKTVFNILGPLISPANTKYGVYGVYSEELAAVYSNVFNTSAVEYNIVHNLDGYDEVSLTDNTLIYNKKGAYQLKPDDFNCKMIEPRSIFGGSNLKEAATIFCSVLDNTATEAQINVVIANAAIAINLVREDLDLITCKLIAKESIESGAAKKCLENVVSITKQYL